MGIISRILKKSHDSRPLNRPPYSPYDPEYIALMNNYYSTMDNIESLWSVIYNLNDYYGPESERLKSLCLKNLDELFAWQNAAARRNIAQMPGHVPAYHRLAMLYEKRGQYEFAINVCVDAIRNDATSDGSKGGMKGRLARMLKKAKLDPSPEIRQFLM